MLARRIQGVMRQYGPEVAFFTVEALTTLYLRPLTCVMPHSVHRYEKPMNEVLERELGEEPYASSPWTHEAYLTRLGQLVQAYTAAGRWYSDGDDIPTNREWGSNLWSALPGPPNDWMRGTRFDVLVPWVALQVARWLKAEREWRAFPRATMPPELSRARRAVGRIVDNASELADWANATHPNLMSMSVAAAYAAAGDWHDEMARQATGKKAVPGEVVYRFADGWTFEQLVLGAQLSAEGETMGHCVGGATYRQGVEGGAMRIFSLRDPEGVPHVTVEVGNDIAYRAHTGAPEPASGGLVYYTKQIKGRGNSQVAELSLCRRLEEAFAAADLSPDDPDWTACWALLDAEAARVRRPNPVTRSCWDDAARGVARRANPAFAPLPFHRIAPNAWAKTRYGFTHEGEQYVVDFEPSRSPVPVAGRDPRWPEWIVLDAYIVAFYRARDANTRRQFAVLGTGGVVPILGTVGAVLRTFVAEQQPEAVGFTAELVETSRVRLYQRLMSRLEIPGYMQSTSTGSEVAQFFLVREDVRERVAARERRYLHQREAARGLQESPAARTPLLALEREEPARVRVVDPDELHRLDEIEIAAVVHLARHAELRVDALPLGDGHPGAAVPHLEVLGIDPVARGRAVAHALGDVA